MSINKHSPGCNCCTSCFAENIGEWTQEPTGNPLEDDAIIILSTDEFDQIQGVQMTAEVTATHREQGYHFIAHFNDLLAGRSLPDVDMVSMFLDGGAHEVRFRYESFDAPWGWDFFDCQHQIPMTVLVQLWRGTTLLNEVRFQNDLGTHGVRITRMCGSLKGGKFYGGIGQVGGNLVLDGNTAVVADTTTTHNGGECWVVILDKGGRYHFRDFNGDTIAQSEEIAITKAVLSVCDVHLPLCTACDDAAPYKSISVFIPSYKMATQLGTFVDCDGGTFVLDYVGACEWHHASDTAEIYITFSNPGGAGVRLIMWVATCIGYSCAQFEAPLVGQWLSDVLVNGYYPLLLCSEFNAVELVTTVDGVDYTAEVSSVT